MIKPDPQLQKHPRIAYFAFTECHKRYGLGFHKPLAEATDSLGSFLPSPTPTAISDPLIPGINFSEIRNDVGVGEMEDPANLVPSPHSVQTCNFITWTDLNILFFKLVQDQPLAFHKHDLFTAFKMVYCNEKTQQCYHGTSCCCCFLDRGIIGSRKQHEASLCTKRAELCVRFLINSGEAHHRLAWYWKTCQEGFSKSLQYLSLVLKYKYNKSA